MAFMLIYPTDNTDTNTSTRTEFWLSGLPGMKTCRALYQKMGSVDSSSYLITAAAIYLDCATQDLSETWFFATICNVELHTRKVVTML